MLTKDSSPDAKRDDYDIKRDQQMLGQRQQNHELPCWPETWQQNAPLMLALPDDQVTTSQQTLPLRLLLTLKVMTRRIIDNSANKRARRWYKWR
jgi:hypothetical protein